VKRASRGPWSERTRARTIAIAACFTTGLATAAIPLVAGGAPARPQLLLAGAAMLALGVGLIGWAPALTFAAVALGAEYSLRLGDRHNLDGLVILEAVALLTTVELGLRALEARSIARRDPVVRRNATMRMVAMVSGAALSAFVVLTVGSRELPAPNAALAVGLGAAVTLLVGTELLRRRATRTEGG
jgi:hypothetical protein